MAGFPSTPDRKGPSMVPEICAFRELQPGDRFQFLADPQPPLVKSDLPPENPPLVFVKIRDRMEGGLGQGHAILEQGPEQTDFIQPNVGVELLEDTAPEELSLGGFFGLETRRGHELAVLEHLSRGDLLGATYEDLWKSCRQILTRGAQENALRAALAFLEDRNLLLSVPISESNRALVYRITGHGFRRWLLDRPHPTERGQTMAPATCTLDRLKLGESFQLPHGTSFTPGVVGAVFVRMGTDLVINENGSNRHHLSGDTEIEPVVQPTPLPELSRGSHKARMQQRHELAVLELLGNSNLSRPGEPNQLANKATYQQIWARCQKVITWPSCRERRLEAALTYLRDHGLIAYMTFQLGNGAGRNYAITGLGYRLWCRDRIR
jgi:hypothetical protein